MSKAATIIVVVCLGASAGCSAFRMGSATTPPPTPAAGGQPLAEFNAAVALAAELQYKQANERFAAAIQGFESAGDDARAAEATFWMGYCYEKRDRPEDAAAFYKRVESRYPRSPAAEQARRRRDRLPKPPKP